MTRQPKRRAARKARGDGVAIIAAVREQQRKKWSTAHDDEHDDASLVVRACELALHHTGLGLDCTPDGFEWDAWRLVKRFGDYPLQRLSVAGALIAAEIDRRLRAAEIQPRPRAGKRDGR